MRMAEHNMSDFHVIRYNPEHRPLQPQDTVRVHEGSVAWLRGELAKCNPARTVVVTHHSPSARAEAPFHAKSPLKPAFSSNLDSLIEQAAFRCGFMATRIVPISWLARRGVLTESTGVSG